MNIKVERANFSDKEKLENLMQLYLHDISLYFKMDFDSKTCSYNYEELDLYLTEENRHAYFIYNDNDVVGFSLIDIKEENVMQEMFILNNYKSLGFGYEAAKLLFDMFRGTWVVKALPCSKPAENFWTKTLKKYTNDNFELEHVGKYNRACFKFNN